MVTQMTSNKCIWLRDLHHSPYLVIEGELQGTIDSKELFKLLSNNFREVDINNKGEAYSLGKRSL